MVVTPQTQVLRTGDALRIQCVARGGDRPITLEWQRGGGGGSYGTALPSSASDRGDGLLEIPRLTAADAGQYKCVGVNNAGRAEAYADVQLIGNDGSSAGFRTEYPMYEIHVDAKSLA